MSAANSLSTGRGANASGGPEVGDASTATEAATSNATTPDGATFTATARTTVSPTRTPAGSSAAAPLAHAAADSRLPAVLAFAAGCASLLWIGWGYTGHHLAALVATAVIAAFYLAGAWELHRFAGDTRALALALRAVDGPVRDLPAWLATLPGPLRHPVRQRVESGAAALPGPALTPYLVGLLVLLGMTGTFIGMVSTLRGTGLALETATDVATIRASLAAPVKGLGLAFGTSVAGVAASAMLGLMSALCRRDRLRAARLLDALTASHLRPHGPAQYRESTTALLQRHIELASAWLERSGAMLDAQHRQNQALVQHLLDGQARHHEHSLREHATLRDTLRESLESSLGQTVGDALVRGSQQTAAVLEPLVARALGGVAAEAIRLQQQMLKASQQQADHLALRLEASATRSAEGWEAAQREAMARDEQWRQQARQAAADLSTAFERRAAEHHSHTAEALDKLLDEASRRDQQRLASWTQALDTAGRTVSAELARTADQVGAQLDARSQATLAQMGSLAQATLAQISSLAQDAAQAPRLAAEVVGELRQRLSDSLAHDNRALAERNELLQTTAQVLAGLQHAAGEQREALDRLLALTENQLNQAVGQLAQRAAGETDRMAEAATQLAAGGVELAGLGDAFAAAVLQFGDTAQHLAQHLQRIEDALERQMARSDDQLAYTVAQARELIDLSVMSQKRLLDEMRQLVQPGATA